MVVSEAYKKFFDYIDSLEILQSDVIYVLDGNNVITDYCLRIPNDITGMMMCSNGVVDEKPEPLFRVYGTDIKVKHVYVDDYDAIEYLKHVVSYIVSKYKYWYDWYDKEIAWNMSKKLRSLLRKVIDRGVRRTPHNTYRPYQ